LKDDIWKIREYLLVRLTLVETFKLLSGNK